MTTVTRTAGMANGMAAWQRELMGKAPEKRMTDEDYVVLSKLEAALAAVFSAEGKLCMAADYAAGTPMEDRIQSVLTSLEQMEAELRKLKEGLA